MRVSGGSGHSFGPKAFDSCSDFANFLDTTIKMRVAAIPALEFAAQEIEKAAKEEIGEYQRENMGSFAPWEELHEWTKTERVQLGYTENDPLLRSGELRDSIGHHTDVSGHEAVIGSPEQKLVYLELGTKFMAPRSVLGLAAHRSKKKIIRIVGELTVAALLNVDFSEHGSSIFDHKEE